MEVKMNYKCYGTFMVRVPALSLDTYDFLCKNNCGNILEQISKNRLLFDFLDSSLPISSRTLHRSFLAPSSSLKRQRNLSISLKKYLNRACTRPTPFGLMAGTALGKFSDATSLSLNSDESHNEIKADFQWLMNIVYQLEKDPALVKQLKVKFNPSCYVWGDRLKNPYFTNHGILTGGEKSIDESDIKYTKLIKLLQTATSFISYQELHHQIFEQCNGISEQLIDTTLQDLIENEYLLTELRIPVYCTDPLKYIIDILKTKEGIESVLSQLEQIYEELLDYNNAENKNELIQHLYSQMETLQKANNLVCINKGARFFTCTLDRIITTQIEKFANCMAHIAVERKEYSILNVFREAFLEKYGLNVEVPLAEVLDPNGFDGLSKIEAYNHDISKREAEIKRVFDKSIMRAIMNEEQEVRLFCSDFNQISEQSVYSKSAISFDLNCIITQNRDGTYYIQLGSNAGSEKAGEMFQRFSNVVDVDLMKSFNQIYQIETDLIGDEYILVEAREVPASGRVANIVNCMQQHPYYLAMGCTDQETSDEISIHDLCIGITEGRFLYIKSISKNKKCKIIVDNMESVRVNNKVIRFLRYISEEYENSILKRCFRIHQNEYVYVPRIALEGVVIHPRSWNFLRTDLDTSNYEKFKEKFMLAFYQYKVDKRLYLCDGDQKLLISCESDDDIRVLYNHMKKCGELYLTEVEPNLFSGSLVKDELGRPYNSEFVFSLFLSSSIRERELLDNRCIEKDICNNKLRCVKENRFILCENGWVYFKIYGIGRKENDVLTKFLPNLLKQLQFQKFFFLRYAEEGNHLRIRFQFAAEEYAYEGLKNIKIWVSDLMKRGLVNRVVYDTYERETSRYGGIELISLAEEVFYADSLFVLGILTYFDLQNSDDRAVVFTVGICSAFFALTGSVTEAFSILNEEGLRRGFKHDFQEKRSTFLHVVKNVAESRLIDLDSRFQNIIQQYSDRDKIMTYFGKQLNKKVLLKDVSKKKADVLFSIVHMYCNRILGDTKQEGKYLAITRNAIYAYLEEKKHYSPE